MPPTNTLRASKFLLSLSAALGLYLLLAVLVFGPSTSQAAGSVVLVNDTFKCSNYPQPVDFDLVKVTITAGQSVRRDAVHTSGSGGECTGRIGRLEVDTWDADGVKVHNDAHDLVIEGGYIRCHANQNDVHQDGIQAMGGNRVTFKNLLVDCATPEGVNSAMFINMGAGENGRPTDVVCDGCTLMKNVARNRVLRISDSVRSGARNSTIVWCGTGPGCGDGPAVMILESAATAPVNENNREVLHSQYGPPPPPPPGPSAPGNTALPALSGNAQEGSSLTTSNGTWTNTPTAYAYQWRRCDTAGSNCSSIAGATSSSYTLVAADVGSRLRAVVTASNAAGSNSATSAASATVAPAPAEPPPAPVNITHPEISGTPQVGEVLSSSTGTWSNSPTQFDYKWRRCNAAGAECHRIDGVSSSTYELTNADVGMTLRVVVTASNTEGFDRAKSSPTQVIAPAPSAPPVPDNTVPPSVRGAHVKGTRLRASSGEWTNNPQRFTYQWRRCVEGPGTCADIPGATGDDYVPVQDDVGRWLSVRVTAWNQVGSSTASSPQTGERVRQGSAHRRE